MTDSIRHEVTFAVRFGWLCELLDELLHRLGIRWKTICAAADVSYGAPSSAGGNDRAFARWLERRIRG